MQNTEKGSISVSTENIFPIIKKWLYSEKDIFVRELVSNASDAIGKLRGLAGVGEAELGDDEKFRVDVTLDKEAKTIAIEDNGIGMTADEVKKYINQIAFSGAQEYFEKFKDKASDAQIIGHFGLGFYSAFMASEMVEIDTLSYLPGAEAVAWESDGNSEYSIGPSERTKRGTKVTMHIAEDSTEYLDAFKLREVLMKYFRFLPYELYLTDTGAEKKADEPEKPINSVSPLWNKQPKDCTEDEYKEFYHEVFSDYTDPLFHVHLNIDYPFRLKGILYFPRIKNEMSNMEGQVKLYCNQVFVADNLKEVIPEYLLLLKGCIDCPDLPLNVSRSFLQNDGTVIKLSAHIVKKVSDKLVSLFENDREQYCKYWDDINPFIKFGCLRDDKFYERVSKALIFKTIDDEYKTVEEYIAALPVPPEPEKKDGDKDKQPDTPRKTVYYVTDKTQQAAYIDLFKKNGIGAVVLDQYIDNYFISFLESKDQSYGFKRIDSDLSELSSTENVADEADSAAVEGLFKTLNDKMEVKTEGLKDGGLPAFLVLSEQARRFEEMSRMYGGGESLKGMFPGGETLIINTGHPLILSLAKMAGRDETKDDAALLAAQVYDIARLNLQPLDEAQMKAFTERSIAILEKVTK